MDEDKDLIEKSENSDDENKSAISADLIRGHINTIILRTLYERDKYGYEIIEEIEKKSHGQYSLKQPTLYSALKRLETQGYINAYWKTDEVSLGGRRKYYTLTDSGREITERNQAEWEYSRTVIDNLISDRSFDFSQPAPIASVDFKILKKSTSRVPVVRDGEDYENDEYNEQIKDNDKAKPAEVSAPDTEDKPVKQTSVIPQVKIQEETVTFTTNEVVFYDAPAVLTMNEKTPEAKAEQPIPTPTPAPVCEPITEQQVKSTEVTHNSQPAPLQASAEQPVGEQSEYAEMSEEQRRIVHENYLRLISEPVVEEKANVVPVADDIDTEKLIYNNKPKTERDYKNLISNLFDKTLTQRPAATTSANSQIRTQAEVSHTDDLASKAEQDGLKINTSDFVISTRKKSYNRGATLFKSSLIVTIILLLEFTVGILFKNELGVGITYPFVILAIAIAQLLIFGVIYYTDLGKSTRKPSSTIYLSACIIVTVILILIIFLVSLLLQVNFTSAGDIFAKIIIPCLVALNIPVFAGCFYAFSK